MTAGILPDRRVRRAPPLPNSVRTSAVKRISDTVALLLHSSTDGAASDIGTGGRQVGTTRSRCCPIARLSAGSRGDPTAGTGLQRSASKHRVDNGKPLHQPAGTCPAGCRADSLAEATPQAYKGVGAATKSGKGAVHTGTLARALRPAH